MPTNINGQCCNGVNIDQLSSDINRLTQELTHLKKQVELVNDHKAVVDGRLYNAEKCCEDTQERIDQQNAVIGEVGDNITLLKTLHNSNREAIEWLQKKVIIDDKYLCFEDWVENVYIPQCWHIENKYSEGDIYVNVNQDVAATNATYVNKRPANSTKPCSANDWQELYYSAPADVLTIIGIDPIEVTHPYKHEWVISVNPNRLADMLADLRSLDLSKVDVTLGEVYFEPTFKESATFQENVTVNNHLKSDTFETNDAHINKLCVDEFTCDINTVNNSSVNKSTANVFEWDQANFNKLNSHDNHFGDTIFEWDVKYINNEDGQVICMDNVMKDTFRPSYGIFSLHGSWYFLWKKSDTWYNNAAPNHSVVFGLGSDSISTFNDHDPNPVKFIAHNTSENATYIEWDKRNYCNNVYLDSKSWNICIDGRGEDAGIYLVNFTMTLLFDKAPGSKWTSHNMWAHRAWVVVFDPQNPTGFIIDAKHDGRIPEFTYVLPQHTHTVYDHNNGEWASGSDTETTSKANWLTNGYTQNLEFTPANELMIHMTSDHVHWSEVSYYNNIHQWLTTMRHAFDDHWTYTVNVAIPVDTLVEVAPFFKPSSTSPNWDLDCKFTITEGTWVTWGISQIFVHKIANLGHPHEYHC